MRFVGVVLAGTTVHARVEIDDNHADFEVSDANADRVVVVGTAELPQETP